VPTTSPTVRRRRLGIELRRLREASGMTIEQVAQQMECSVSKISRIETARVGVSMRDIRDMLDFYGVSSEEQERLLNLARDARQKAWWHAYSDLPDVKTYIGLEVAAASIRAYEALLVPGLLQTPEYARTIISTALPGLHPEQVERRVELRMTRQSMLVGDDPPMLSVVVDEAVLHRVVAGRGIMRQQLHHLAETADQPNVSMQLLPFVAGQHLAMSGAFTILSFSEPTDPEIVYLEHGAGDLYIEGVEQTKRYVMMFDHLRAVALAPSDSAAFLRRLAKGL
jgi:transcriptional regulator with XRE-family HTH domain